MFIDGKVQGKIIPSLELGQSLLSVFLGDSSITPILKNAFAQSIIDLSTQLYESTHWQFMLTSLIYGPGPTPSTETRAPFFALPDWMEYERIHNEYGMLGERVINEMKMKDELEKEFKAIDYLSYLQMPERPQDPNRFPQIENTIDLPDAGLVTPFDHPLFSINRPKLETDDPIRSMT